MLENLKKIVQNIQEANETKKKRWLFVLSTLIMILVVGFWVACLSKTIVNLGPAEPTESTNQPPIQISKESPWQVFVIGIKAIASQIKDLIAATNKMSLEVNPSDFASSSEEIIPKQ